jgi:formylmethanofuran dehydrogenase subunit D
MTTLKVEQYGEDLVIRLTPEAKASLGLRAGDEVLLARSVYGEISLAAADMDHQLRLERGRAFLRRFRSPAQ